MDKALEIGRTSATGSLQLFVGVAASTIIMAVGTVVLARLMSPEEYGLYSVALIPSYMIVLFRDWGINSALTRYIAYYRATKREGKIRNIIVAGLTFEIAMGLVLSFLSFGLAGFIAATVFRRPESSFLIAIVSATIFSGALQTAAESSFRGFERMEFNSLVLIFLAVVKVVVSPLLVFFGYGALGATVGYTVSFVAAGVMGFALLYFALFKRLKNKDAENFDLSETLKEMLRFGVPLSISSILSGFLVQFYGFMMAFYCTDLMIGNYQVAVQFSMILTFFTTPISMVLFPAFSKVDSQNERELLKTVFTSSVKYSSFILAPATMAIMVLSKPLVSTLFGEKWVYAPFFLTIYVVSNLFVVFGSLSLGGFLAGMGETRTLMKLGLLTVSCGMPLAFLFIPWLGILGVIVTGILAGLPSMFLGLFWVWKRYKIKTDFKSSARICLASFFSAVITYVVLFFVNFADWVRLIVGGTAFIVVYLFVAPIIGAINFIDARNLRVMFSSLGIVSKFLDVPLTFMERLSKYFWHEM